MSTRAPNTCPSPGHTLWEVLLVLAVLGAVGGLAAPSLRLGRRQTNAVAQSRHEIVALLESARLTAVQRGTAVELRLDPPTGHAWMFAAEGDTLRLIATSTLTDLSAVEVLGGAELRVRYVFTADGQAFGRPVVLRGAGGIERITVDPWTGGTHVTR